MRVQLLKYWVLYTIYSYYSEFSTVNTSNPAKIVYVAGGFNGDGKVFIKFTSNKAVRVHEMEPTSCHFFLNALPLLFGHHNKTASTKVTSNRTLVVLYATFYMCFKNNSRINSVLFWVIKALIYFILFFLRQKVSSFFYFFPRMLTVKTVLIARNVPLIHGVLIF